MIYVIDLEFDVISLQKEQTVKKIQKFQILDRKIILNMIVIKKAMSFILSYFQDTNIEISNIQYISTNIEVSATWASIENLTKY